MPAFRRFNHGINDTRVAGLCDGSQRLQIWPDPTVPPWAVTGCVKTPDGLGQPRRREGSSPAAGKVALRPRAQRSAGLGPPSGYPLGAVTCRSQLATASDDPHRRDSKSTPERNCQTFAPMNPAVPVTRKQALVSEIGAPVAAGRSRDSQRRAKGHVSIAWISSRLPSLAGRRVPGALGTRPARGDRKPAEQSSADG